jgi:MoxR-like ATPase
VSLRRCPGYAVGNLAPHSVEEGVANFSPGKSQCRDCYRAYAADWRAKRAGLPAGQATTRARRAPIQAALPLPTFMVPTAPPTPVRMTAVQPAAPSTEPTLGLGEVPDDESPLEADLVSEEELVSDAALAATMSHEYVAPQGLKDLWAAVSMSVALGDHPDNLMFLGPSGCGKTQGAQYLAGLVGLPFTKVDAAAMTDPESWFGTREVVVQDGASVTTYRPSTFVLAISRPGVVLIDEINRVRDEHRNVLLPLLDGTHRVTNPLTGDVVVKHPQCFIIMSGNRGLQFTGTYAVDPALMTRAITWEFDYIGADDEERIVKEATGCDDDTAKLFVRFANETRTKAKIEPDFAPISTREVLAAARLAKRGINPDLAAKVVVMNSASAEGGAASARVGLETIWAGIRRPTATAVLCHAVYPYDGDFKCDLLKGHLGDHDGTNGEADWTGKVPRKKWSAP